MANSLINGPAPGETPAPTAADTSVWMYRKGEAKLFASPDVVPKGWTDSPVAPVEEKADDGNSDTDS